MQRARAASRQAIGTAVFFGMIGNAFLGLVFTPVLYVLITTISERIGTRKKKAPSPRRQSRQLQRPHRRRTSKFCEYRHLLYRHHSEPAALRATNAAVRE
jgi:hypothetical protein